MYSCCECRFNGRSDYNRKKVAQSHPKKSTNTRTGRWFDVTLTFPSQSWYGLAPDALTSLGSYLLANDLGLGKSVSGICPMAKPENLLALVPAYPTLVDLEMLQPASAPSDVMHTRWARPPEIARTSGPQSVGLMGRAPSCSWRNLMATRRPTGSNKIASEKKNARFVRAFPCASSLLPHHPLKGFMVPDYHACRFNALHSVEHGALGVGFAFVVAERHRVYLAETASGNCRRGRR